MLFYNKRLIDACKKKNIFCPRILGELAPVFLKQRYKIRLI